VGSRTTSKGKEHYYFYVCSAKKRLGGCSNNGIRADYLESYVLDKIDRECFQKTKADIKRESEKLMIAYNQKMKFENEELEHVKKELVKIDIKINRFLDAFENGSMAGEIAGQRLDILKNEKDALQSRQTCIMATKPTVTVDGFIDFFTENKNSLADRNDPSELSKIINTYVVEIVVHPGADDARIDIKLKHNVFGYNGSGEGVLTISETITKKELYHRYRNKG